MMLFSADRIQVEIASEIHVTTSTLSTWKTRETFRQVQDEYKRFMLHDLNSEAVRTMHSLLNARSETVRFSTAKDILERSLSNA